MLPDSMVFGSPHQIQSPSQTMHTCTSLKQ
ncbi:hypothetical protein EQ832_07330 [Pseudomonas sp. ALS1131]|nr:hypothetical protein EQ832_07330 [Pseudomonas sp. ALS1131]